MTRERNLGVRLRAAATGVSALAILACSGSAAGAADVEALEAALLSMQAQMKVLQKQVEEAKAAAAAAQAVAAKGSKSDDLDLKVKWKGAPELSSTDGKFKFKVRGRLEADYNGINQDTPITFTPDVAGTELRRARLGVEGVVFYDVKYVFEVDFANDATAIKDAYIQYTGWPVYFTLGNFKTPNSLEEMTSDRYIQFMERAAFVEAFELDRAIGFGASYYKEHFTLAAGIFGEGPGAAPLFSGFTGDENLTFAARGTVAPINREVNGVNQVLHFGASVRTRDVGDDQPFLQYRARGADLHLANRFVQTGRIGESDTFWGLEAAGVWGPVAVTGEYAQTEVDLPRKAVIRNTSTSGAAATPLIPNPFIGDPDPTYSGWYVDASWFLTGETRVYKDGKFDRPKVKHPVLWGKGGGGWGAWQIAGRYDVIDLSDNAFNLAGGCRNTSLGVNTSTGATPASIAQCGEQETWLIGINWWLNDYTRLMFDYTQSELSGYPVTTVGSNTTVPVGTKVSGFDGATIRGFGMRAQVDW